MSQKGMDSAHDANRAIRLRENKRRNRQRQKDYTADLESRLRRLESEGIKATQEVQAAARKVVEDNLRLKALLRCKGVDEHTINTWTPEGIMSRSSIVTNQTSITTDKTPHLPILENSASSNDEKPAEAQMHSSISPSAGPELQPGCSSNVEKALWDESSPKLAPCKLMSRIAENPGADLTQIGVPELQVEENGADGMECSKAYKLLIQFATTEEKLDIISQALESGCKKGPKGGCKVQNAAILNAIDKVS